MEAVAYLRRLNTCCPESAGGFSFSTRDVGPKVGPEKDKDKTKKHSCQAGRSDHGKIGLASSGTNKTEHNCGHGEIPNAKMNAGSVQAMSFRSVSSPWELRLFGSVFVNQLWPATSPAQAESIRPPVAGEPPPSIGTLIVPKRYAAGLDIPAPCLKLGPAIPSITSVAIDMPE